MTDYIAYRRVSTKGQGESGLGLEAQDRDIALYLDSYAQPDSAVIATFTDVASGTANNRPELAKALDMARATGATLLVAKLDRLSRKVSFLATIMEDKRAALRVASMPAADSFQLHIYAALAEQERTFISQRTKAALTAAKERGVKLGGLRAGTAQRNAATAKAAEDAAARIAPIITPMRAAGATLQSIADALNVAGQPTPRGAQWSPTTVRAALLRIAA